jgi:hypothetical protein
MIPRRLLHVPKKVRPQQNNPSRGQALTLSPLPQITKRSIRGIAKDLVGHHTTEIAMRLREGMLSSNLRLALKYLTFVGDRTDGRPVETHRMVGLQDGPTGTYDLSKLNPTQQKALLKLLRDAKDTTESKGEVK